MLKMHVRGEAGYEDALTALARRGDADLEKVEPAVRAILSEVRERGDAAIRDLTARFESRTQDHVAVPEADWRAVAARCPAEVREKLAAAAERATRVEVTGHTIYGVDQPVLGIEADTQVVDFQQCQGNPSRTGIWSAFRPMLSDRVNRSASEYRNSPCLVRHLAGKLLQCASPLPTLPGDQGRSSRPCNR